MEGHLNLIKTDYKEVEKRVLPRFPFSFLTFKGNGPEGNKVFEVKDISYNGMRLSLKDGGHTYITGSNIVGCVHWKGETLDTEGTVKWVSGHNLGVEFNVNDAFKKNIREFLGVENILKGLRAIHNSPLDIDLPSNLKYWLRSDGKFEVFIWRHNDGEISKFQILFLDFFVEWQDGKGLKTGSVINSKNIDSPLENEGELLFEFEDSCDGEKVNFARDITSKITEDFLPQEALEFLALKLGS